MRRKKIKITLIVLAAALVAIIAQTIVAHYTHIGEAVNVITSGDISAKIIEKMGDKDFPKEGVTVMPGSVVSKKVSVVNTGGHPFWLRVKLTDVLEDDTLSVEDETISSNMIEPDINLQDWIAGTDGYYYYKEQVQPGTETEKLFTQVKISGDVDSSYLGKSILLKVTAYAVQSENNGTSPLNAVGWPAEGGGGA